VEYQDEDGITELRAEIVRLTAPPGASAMERAARFVGTPINAAEESWLVNRYKRRDPISVNDLVFGIGCLIEQAEREATERERERCAQIINVARRLCSDVRGCFVNYEEGIRLAMGNTNYSVIAKFAEELDAALHAEQEPKP
jgi:hypothetical protein